MSRSGFAAFVALACVALSPAVASAAESETTAPPKPRAFRIGPSIAMGAPNGFTGGVSTTFKDLVGVDFGASYVPWLALTNEAKLQRIGFEGDVRLYPLRGSFYLGAAGGWAKMSGAAMQTVGTGTAYAQAVTARAGMDYAFVRPEVGFQSVFSNHMFIGARLGCDIPVMHSRPDVTLSVPGGTMSIKGANGAVNALSFIGTHAFPTLTLFEVGFMI